MPDFSRLAVAVSAKVAQFNAGMQTAEEAASDLSLALRRLSFASESADRDIESLGRSATAASGGMVAFGAGTEGAGFAVRGLSASILLSLIPALVALSAALAPIVGALGGFVGVAASIVGVGLLPAIAAIATNTEVFKTEAQSLLDTLGTEFAPVIEEATTVLLLLMRSFRDIIPELVPTQEAIDDLGLLFLELGESLIELLPLFAELAVTLAREWLPPFIEFVQDVGPEIPGMIQDLVDVFDRMLPRFVRAGQLLMDLLGPLTEFGFTVLDVLGPALADLSQFLENVLRDVNNMDRGMQELIAGAALLAPVIVGLVSFIGPLSGLVGVLSSLTGPLTAVIGGLAAIGLAGIVASVAALATNFGGLRDVWVNQVLPAINRVRPALEDAFGAFAEGFDMESIRQSAAQFEQIFANQIQKNVEALKPVLSDIQTFLTDNQEEFKTLGAVAGETVTFLIRVFGALAKAGGVVFRQVLIPSIQIFIDVLDVALTKFMNLVELFNAVESGNWDAALAATQDLALGEGSTLTQSVAQQTASTQQVEIVLDEQTEFVEARFRDTAEGVFSQQSQNQYDTAQRLGNRNP